MNRSPARAAQTVAAFVLASACVALAVWAPGWRGARAQTPERAAERAPAEGAAERAPEPRSAIYGRAVSESTGRPLRRARIALMMLGGSRVDRGGLTDARGEFRIGNLPAGRYVVWADVAGLLTPSDLTAADGSSDISFDPEEVRRHFDVVELDGKAEREVTLRARRGGALTGRVTYADGDPAVGVVVHILRRGAEGRTTPARISRSYAAVPRTDDRGVYRVSGLAPGEYVVAVAEAADHVGTGETRGSVLDVPGMADLVFNQQLLMTYHPSATSARAAETVSVRAGEESAGVDVTIPDRELRTIAGVVRAARGGRPLRGARVSLVPRDEDDGAARPSLHISGGATADAEGRWQLREIPDGPYNLHITPPEESEPGEEAGPASANRNARNMNGPVDADVLARARARRRPRFAPLRRELRVSADVDELVVELGEGARISGTVVVEGGKGAPFMHISARRVAKTLMESVSEQGPDAEVSGGVFELEGLTPGKYFLHARDFSDEGGFYVKSVTWHGRDLLREPLEVSEGAHIEGVRVVYGSDPAALTVRVSRAGKQPAYNVNVFLLPADLSSWSVFKAQLFCSTGDDGSCRLTAPPGDYIVVTSPLVDLLTDPEQELRRRAPDAPRVTLRPNEEKTLDTVVKEK